jgi:hypothetical protein
MTNLEFYWKYFPHTAKLLSSIIAIISYADFNKIWVGFEQFRKNSGA